MSQEMEQARRLIDNAQRVLITCHIRPDGDAVGSIAGLKQAVELSARQQGREKELQLLLLSNLGENYRFLLPDGTWILRHTLAEDDLTPELLDGFDLLIICDTSAYRQLEGIADYLKERQRKGMAGGQSAGAILVIDHHLSSDEIGHCRVVDTSVGAAGELVYRLIQHAGWPIDQTAANALFTAISTDTGWFRFENTKKAAFEVAADLMAAGARPDELYQKLFLNDPPERLELIKLTLATLELHADGKLAVMHITNTMLAEAGAHRTLIENIVNLPMSIGTVDAVVLMVQVDGGTRCSLRSKKLLDVDKIARRFGGGGHARAAGLTVDKDIESFKTIIIGEMAKELANR